MGSATLSAGKCELSKRASDPARWYVVRSLPRKERTAQEHLYRQGFQTYLPLLTSASTLAGSAAHQAAFFPGYLFVRLSLARDRWRSVNGTIGVANMLHVGGHPTPAPHGLVEHLIDKTNKFGELGFEDVLQPGRAVRVIGGPFDRLLGTFEGLDGTERALVLLNMMGRPVSVSISRGAVMAV
jgi:transcription elongation factor/antiterminator RfaH